MNHAHSNPLLVKLSMLNEIGAALSSERDIDALLERILDAARDLANADGGTLYRVDGDALVFEVLRNRSLGDRIGGKHGASPSDLPHLPLHLPDGRPNTTMVAALAALNGNTISIEDAYADDAFDFTGTRRFDAQWGYRSRSFLTVPMKDHSGAVVAVLQLINAMDPDGNVRAFSEDDRRLVESLASQAAVALNNRRLVSQLEELLESLIDVINVAIDEKSPHTGHHCGRVPVLTMLLADAASRSEEGPLSQFRMSEADRYELKLAGLLHDCGKIVTPTHIIEKSTKLQTIFDRIALVDTRYEVLLRDAEIAKLKGELDEAGYAHRCAQLLADRELLRRCNVGGETMDETMVGEIARIGAGTWRPHGASTQPLLSADEIENLSVRRGTLTEHEREIINHHIVTTIRMLETLPWPPHLRNVTEYAGGHHERMDGKGYPKGLTREQLSIPARIMGIADIFEALTSQDRPYKTPKPLSKALAILGKMSLNGHIDPDLFEVFVRERVYLDYARRFLESTQIDSIDWNRIPGIGSELAAHLSSQISGTDTPPSITG
jgi:HD-GYP domain-containing protein (c-di-GMP phosphodiesterase class II)